MKAKKVISYVFLGLMIMLALSTYNEWKQQHPFRSAYSMGA